MPQTVESILRYVSGADFLPYFFFQCRLRCRRKHISAFRCGSRISTLLAIHGMCGIFPITELFPHTTNSIQFHGLGVNWAGTLLGCVASLLVPIPVFFYLYGPKLRAKSKFAPTFFPASQAADDEHHE
jgi:hypothetical protein